MTNRIHLYFCTFFKKIFLKTWTIFKDCCVCYNITSVLCIDFLVVRHMGSQPFNRGSNLHPPALEGEVFNYWITREVFISILNLSE